MRLKVLINSYGNDLFIVKIYRFTAVGHQVAPTDTCAIVSLERTFSLEETNLPTKTKVKNLAIFWSSGGSSGQQVPKIEFGAGEGWRSSFIHVWSFCRIRMWHMMCFSLHIYWTIISKTQTFSWNYLTGNKTSNQNCLRLSADNRFHWFVGGL